VEFRALAVPGSRALSMHGWILYVLKAAAFQALIPAVVERRKQGLAQRQALRQAAG
jgi:hypothetical protein